MITVRDDYFKYEYFFWYSLEELEQKGFKFMFFLKQFGYFRYVVNKKFALLLEVFDKNNMTFDQFLE
jgi:hypothetical protein